MNRNQVNQSVIDLSGLPGATNDAYVPLFTDDSRYLVLYGGAGSGKSIFTKDKVLYRIITEDNHRYLVCRKVANTLKKSVFASFVETIYEWGLGQYFQINKTDMTITYKENGSVLMFMGMDDSEKLKSIHRVTGIWMEEASEFTLDDFTQLDLRLRGKLKHYKQIILSFNPISAAHWLKKRFFDHTDSKAKVVHTTYKDNRFLDQEYIDVLDELKQTNRTYYDIYALGKWGVLKGLIYPDYKLVDEMPADCELRRWGQDFGFNNPSATVEIGIVGRDLYVNEVLYEKGLTNADLIKRLDADSGRLKQQQGFMDSAEPDRIQEFRNNQFRVQPAKKDVKAGIDKVQSYNLHVVKGSQNIIKELGLYCWKLGKDDEPLDEPVKQNDHAMDALRYAVFLGNKLEVNKLSYKVGGL